MSEGKDKLKGSNKYTPRRIVPWGGSSRFYINHLNELIEKGQKNSSTEKRTSEEKK